MGRFYVELSVTVYADSEDEAERIGQELAGAGVPHWPSAAQRYWTSDMKRGPIDAALRAFTAIVSAEGVRAGESRARAKKPASEPRRKIITRTRQAITWRPLLRWGEDDVWAACGTSAAELAARRARHDAGDTLRAMDGWPCHPAYVLGNGRLSCALCVLADRRDLANGLRHVPALARRYIEMERATGFTFTADLSLEAYARQLGLLDAIMTAAGADPRLLPNPDEVS